MAESKYSVKILAEFSDNVSQKAKQASFSLENLNKKIKDTGKSMKDLGSTLSTNITLPLVGFGAAALKVSGEMEALQADFTTLMGGNIKAAENFTKALKDMGASTPFETMDLAKNSKLLLSFGIAQERVLPILRMIGDVSGGDAQKLNSLSLAFAQVQSQGKMTGQDLMQMINAGFNPLQVISKRTGESIEELKDRMSEGELSAQEIAQAFQDATSEGGLFFKGMDRGSKTLPGLISTMKDAFTDLLLVMGDILKDQLDLSNLIPKFSAYIQDLAKNIKEWTKENPKLAKFITILLLSAAAMGPLLFGVGKIVGMFGMMSSGLNHVISFAKILGKSLMFLGKYGFKALQLIVMGLRMMTIAAINNPIILLVAAIVAAAVLIYKYWEPIKTFFSNLWDGITSKLAGAIDYIKALINDLVKKLSFGLIGDLLEIKTAPIKSDLNNINKNENSSEIVVRVESEKGTTSKIDSVRTTKGTSNVRVSNKTSMGRAIPAL